jgi:hypothetical protein
MDDFLFHIKIRPKHLLLVVVVVAAAAVAVVVVVVVHPVVFGSLTHQLAKLFTITLK